MLNKVKKSKSDGFTIIEVLIVLAIAGLILVVVFLAVPALQRSQRNNGRNAESSRIASAATTFVANNQGNMPTSADSAAIVADFGTVKYLGTGTLAAGTSGAYTTKELNIVSGGTTNQTASATNAQGSGNKDGVLIVTDAKCPATTVGASLTSVASPRSIAVFYAVETSGTNNIVCENAS